MNYSKHYDSLIKRALARDTINGYYEIHHIIPKCIGGSNEPDNLVKLTAREHAIAHLLLSNMYPDNLGLSYAAQTMNKSGSKSLEKIRKRTIELSVSFHTGRKRSKETCLKISNSLKGKRLGIKFTEEHKQNISKGKMGHKHSKETCEKLSSRIISDEWRLKNSLANKGRKDTAEGVANKIAYWSNPVNQEKHSIAMIEANKVKVQCPHCSKSVSRSNYARWHGDNCKLKR